jgi:hypothetical protein
MWISRLTLALVLAGPFVYGQLPSIAERALKRQKQKEENEARHAAAVEKQKANEEARQKAREEGVAAGQERRAKAAEENADAAKLRESAAARRSASRTSKPDPNAEQGVTGPLHEKYMKKVVFVKADRLVDEVVESEFTNEFTLGQPVYFRVYMEQTGPKALVKAGAANPLEELALGMLYTMRVSVDGKAPMDLKFTGFTSKSNNLSWTTWRGYFIKEPNAEITSDQGGAIFREFVARASQKGLLTPGKHSMKVEIFPSYDVRERPKVVGEVVASGEVTMNVPAGVITASNPDLCISYKTVTPKDAALEAQILKTAQAVWPDKVNRPVYVQMASPVWRIERHPVSGIILHRKIDTVVATKGPEYCEFRGYHFQQVFEGNAYAPGTLMHAERSGFYMPCACLAK